MVNLFISILLAISILAPSCSEKPGSKTPSWLIQLKTSGGFAGRGNGNVEITSTGQITYEAPRVPNSPSSPCKGKLSDEDLRQLKDLVAHNNADDWKKPDLNVAAPDAFSYKLILKRDQETFEVTWYDNTQDKLPERLKNLLAVINAAKDKQAKQCTSR